MAYYYGNRGPQSPRDEQNVPAYSNPLSPQRNPNRLSGGMMNTSSARGGLPRRFTTNELPTLSPIGLQRKQAAGEYLPSGYGKPPPSESAVRLYEQLRAQQRRIQMEIERVDPDTRREVDQNLLHEDSIAAMMAASEPASPPEYSNAFPNAFSKPHRFSSSSMTSIQGTTNRPSRSSTQLTSPSAGFARPYTSGNAHLPSQSVPGSRRQSDDEEDDDTFVYGFESGIHRAAANPNRNSMPITGYGRKRNTADLSSFGPVNTTSFLFDDDEDRHIQRTASTTTSPPRGFLQLQQTADGFPTLLDIDASSSALDRALAQGVDPQTQLTDRITASRHRISLPPSALSGNVGIAPLNSILANADSKASANNRRSMEVKFSAGTKRPSLLTSPPRGAANGIMQKASSSYSTSAVPTLRSMKDEDTPTANGTAFTSPSSRQSGGVTDPSSPEPTNISRVTSTTSSSNHRQSQEFSSIATRPEENGDFTPTTSSGLQANAAPFGPMASNTHDSPMQNFGQNGISPYSQQAFYPGGAYNMQMLSNNLGGMNIGGGGYGGQPQWQPQRNEMNMFGQQQGGYGGGYPQYGQQGPQAVGGAGRYGDNQRAVMQNRRQAQEDAQARFNQINVTQLKGEIYSLCKDQHGCRFLQRKLDERTDNSVELIFEEVKEHIIELMTDPFGNYLCQKLLESTNVDQRTVLIKNAMPAMTKIALNQHGTRALQKMIEYITTPEQTNVIIEALRFDVVQLIQDLNGNHVIQKCLNHLTPEDAQFIFDAVGAHCVIVGTHRHGCCVLQRCIDHASGIQKGNLVDQVIRNAFSLVQDPFGNYVVQYILDLGEPCFTEPLCQSFFTNVAFLSKQKFSSNVIEKCIRCAGVDTRRAFIGEIAVPAELEKLLRDSFANYVVQTAMDFADEDMKSLLIENIRPIIPGIRHTPYGRRIQSKISEYDGRSSGAPSGATTPAETLSPSSGHRTINGLSPYAPTQTVPSGGRANRNGWAAPPPQWTGFGAGNAPFGESSFSPNGGYSGAQPNGHIASPTPQRHSNGTSFFAGDFGSPGFTGRQAAPFNY